MNQSQVRLTTPAMRGVMFGASLLVLAVGFSLNVLTEQTDKYFAWTINPPLTAAFFGAGYWSSFILEFFSAREREWAKARLGFFPSFAFSWLALIATIMHKDRFHFDDERFITALGTWVWLVVYISVPIIMTAFLLDQWQAGGVDAEPTAPLPRWLRLFFYIEGFLVIQLGILLFITPENASAVWAWPLSPLTGRVIAAWLVGLGLAEVQTGWENDWIRVRPASYSALAFTGIFFIAMLRFNDVLVWDSIQTWILIGVLASMFGKAVYGIQQFRLIQK